MRLYHLSSPVLLSIGVKLTWSGDGVGREWRWSWELSWSLAIMPCPISHQVASRSHVYPDNCFHQKSSEQCGHSNHWQWPPPAPAWPGHVTQCTGAGANGSDHQLHWSRWDTSFLLRHQRHKDNTSETNIQPSSVSHTHCFNFNLALYRENQPGLEYNCEYYRDLNTDVMFADRLYRSFSRVTAPALL